MCRCIEDGSWRRRDNSTVGPIKLLAGVLALSPRPVLVHARVIRSPSTEQEIGRHLFTLPMPTVSQTLKSVRDCDDAGLDAALAEARKVWGGLAGRLLLILTRKGKRSVAQAWAMLKKAGFSKMGAYDIAFLCESTPLTLADFELIASLWGKLEGVTCCSGGSPKLVRDWVGVRFIQYWQSPSGAAALTPAVLQRLRPLWEAATPTVSQRLSPARACGLNWSAEETVALLNTHIDTNGAMDELARELLSRGILTPAIINDHQGLYACEGLEPRGDIQGLFGLLPLARPQHGPQPIPCSIRTALHSFHPPRL